MTTTSETTTCPNWCANEHPMGKPADGGYHESVDIKIGGTVAYLSTGGAMPGEVQMCVYTNDDEWLSLGEARAFANAILMAVERIEIHQSS